MSDDNDNIGAEELAARRKAALELVFISFVGVVVLGGFIAALTYDFVSARAPLVIMVPLLLLIGVQVKRMLRMPHSRHVMAEAASALTGGNRNFTSVAGFIGVMALLLLLIYVAGHYIGIAVFMFVLLRVVSGERWMLSILITVGVTAVIFVLFEYGFNIELYRGYVYRLFAGY